MAKSDAERQREYARRHPDRVKAKKRRQYAALAALRDRHRTDYEALLAEHADTPQPLRSRLAMRALRDLYPDEHKEISHAIRS